MKKLLSALGALVLGVGLAVAGVSTAAQAHTGDLNASAVCNTTTGEYDVTYVLTISQTGLSGVTNWRTGDHDFNGTPGDNTGLSGAIVSTGAGDITLGTISVPGTETSAPWAYAFTTWSDNYTQGSDGGDIALAGDCSQPAQPVSYTPQASATAPVCDTSSWLVTGSNTATLVGAPDVVWTAAKGGDSDTLPAGIGYTGPPLDGFGTYTVTGADGGTDPLINVVTTVFTFTFVDPSTIDCTQPPADANPGAVLVVACGTADVDLSNELGQNPSQLTASFVIYVDGNFYDAYAVTAGSIQHVSLTFSEDSGDHTVQVRTGPAFGDVLLADDTAGSDCLPPDSLSGSVVTYAVDCDLTLTTTTVPWTQGWIKDGSSWVLDAKVNGTPVVTTGTTDLATLAILGVDAPSDCPTVLAHTGTDTAGVFLAAGGGLILAGGAVFLLVALTRRFQ